MGYHLKCKVSLCQFMGNIVCMSSRQAIRRAMKMSDLYPLQMREIGPFRKDNFH